MCEKLGVLNKVIIIYPTILLKVVAKFYTQKHHTYWQLDTCRQLWVRSSVCQRLSEGRDRPGLEEMQVVSLKGKFDVLRLAVCGLKGSRGFP